MALTPENVSLLKKKGFKVIKIEKGAGQEAKFTDEEYTKSGATMTDAREAYASDIILKVRAPQVNPQTGQEEASLVKEKGTLFSFVRNSY